MDNKQGFNNMRLLPDLDELAKTNESPIAAIFFPPGLDAFEAEISNYAPNHLMAYMIQRTVASWRSSDYWETVTEDYVAQFGMEAVTLYRSISSLDEETVVQGIGALIQGSMAVE